MLGNGFNEARRYGEALAFFERAIKTSNSNPDAGFPFMAYEGESQTLAAQGKMTEAREKLERALKVARANQKRGHEAMILLSLGELALQTGDRERAMKYLEEAGDISQKYNFYRTVGQSMIDLAGLYRDAGDLKSADARAVIGVDASRRVGDRYYLPRDLTVLADLKALRGNPAQAETLYENAEDVIDGMLINLHEAYWSSSVAGAMFALAAGTGARAGELFALRVESDVNLNEQTVTIRRSVFEGEENTSKSDTGDEDRTRTVPIDASVVEELKKHLKGRRSGYLFQTKNCTPLRLSNVLEDKLYPILEKLKLAQPGAGMHAFRRGRISHLVYSGVSRQVIRDWCGHSSDKMIDHYTKLLRQHHAPEMAKLKPLLDPS